MSKTWSWRVQAIINGDCAECTFSRPIYVTSLLQLSKQYKPYKASDGNPGAADLLGYVSCLTAILVRHIIFVLPGCRHVLQLEPACSEIILAEYSLKVESGGEPPVTLQSMNLTKMSGAREYYFSRRHCALKLTLEMCRVARDETLTWCSPAADCLADLFSSVETVDDRSGVLLSSRLFLDYLQ